MTRHRDIVVPKGDYTIRRARVPAVFLPVPVAGAVRDHEGSVLVDLRIEKGRIAAVTPSPVSPPGGGAEVDVEGRMVWPALIDMHTHLDKGEVIPRVQPDGSLDTGANGTAADRAFWTYDDMRARMDFALRCAYAQGVSAIRTHLDSNNELAGRSWSVFRDLREAWAGRILLQGVGLAPLDYFLTEEGEKLADLVADSGGVLGGVTDGIGSDWSDATGVLKEALGRFFTLAEERGLDVDIHVDQTDDPALFTLPMIAEATIERGFAGKVVCGHCVNLALQPDEVIERTVRLCREAGLDIVTLPEPMMYLQDRRPGRGPRWRGVTAANELLAGGVPVAIGGDNCRDAWFAYGDHDMVGTFRQAVRILHLDHPIDQAPGMAGPVPAAMIRAGDLGSIAVGGEARLILFPARNLNELMCRPQSDRIVIDRGRVVTDALPDYAELDAILGVGAPAPMERRAG